MCAEKSTQNPVDITIVIIEIASKFTPHHVIKPITPLSMLKIANATHIEHNGWGISNTAITTIEQTPIIEFCIVFGRII